MIINDKRTADIDQRSVLSPDTFSMCHLKPVQEVRKRLCKTYILYITFGVHLECESK